MSEIKKFIFPGAISILGIVLVIAGLYTGQNGAFMFGAFGILLAGLISVVAAIKQITKQLKLIVSSGLAVLIAGLAYADYMSIKVPIEFQKEKERRYAHVIQRLKDIRSAQQAYKVVYQRYQGNGDSLIAFVKHDSIPFIRAVGEVPDTMSLEDAIKAGIATRDTSYVNVLDSIFTGNRKDKRIHNFNPDSLMTVPFTGGAKFDLQAGRIERSGVKVPVFLARDSKPFDTRDPLEVGSMNDPKTNGNWE